MVVDGRITGDGRAWGHPTAARWAIHPAGARSPG